jgi:hypothetical protein
MDGLDLEQYDVKKVSDEGFELELKEPGTGRPLKAYIRVCGKDADRYRERNRDIQRRRLESLAPGSRPSAIAALDTAEDDELDLLAGCALSWRGILKNGEPRAFNEAEVREVFKRHQWIKEQVDSAIHNRANFLPRVEMK